MTVYALLDELSRQAADAPLMYQAARQMSRRRETDLTGWADCLSEGRSWECR